MVEVNRANPPPSRLPSIASFRLQICSPGRDPLLCERPARGAAGWTLAAQSGAVASNACTMPCPRLLRLRARAGRHGENPRADRTVGRRPMPMSSASGEHRALPGQRARRSLPVRRVQPAHEPPGERRDEAGAGRLACDMPRRLTTYDHALLHTDYWQQDPLLPVPLVTATVDRAKYLYHLGMLNGGWPGHAAEFSLTIHGTSMPIPHSLEYHADGASIIAPILLRVLSGSGRPDAGLLQSDGRLRDRQ